MRYLAIDYGNKRIGLAVCDQGENIASPLKVIYGKKQAIAEIPAIIKEQQVEEVVLGLPLNMDDTEGGLVKQVRDFAEQLQQHIDIPINFHDERLSSFDAESKLGAGVFTRKKKKKRLDAVAAASILQSFIDSKRQQ